MKKFFIISAVLCSVALFTTGCTKMCTCTTVIDSQISDPDMEGLNMDGSAVQEVETKGKCSDLNATSQQSMPGVVYITTVTCE